MRLQTPEIGSLRARSFFAVLPVSTETEMRWFERVHVVERRIGRPTAAFWRVVCLCDSIEEAEAEMEKRKRRPTATPFAGMGP